MAYISMSVDGANLYFDAPHPEADDDDSGQNPYWFNVFQSAVGG